MAPSCEGYDSGSLWDLLLANASAVRTPKRPSRRERNTSLGNIRLSITLCARSTEHIHPPSCSSACRASLSLSTLRPCSLSATEHAQAQASSTTELCTWLSYY
ncbi:hypothetical protein CMUS01_15308 [Colletotrichum musicola]|uniref:Uncharacterized protein n=1 Tax=Colletotrichum musicola TaxID=2175873 RepID=A0A8H6IXB3_9PEZI|nr:hypothetical protein CMUS01_15308 [Colletotrichum musicola]